MRRRDLTALAVVLAACAATSAQDVAPTPPAVPPDPWSAPVTNGLFGLDDADFWTNPWKNGEALFSKHVLDGDYGLFIDAPRSVQPADRSTLPVPIYYAAMMKDAFKVDVVAQTRVVAARLEDRAIFVDAAIEPPDNALPEPKIGEHSSDPTFSQHTSDLARFGLLDQPGTYQVVLLLGQQTSNVVRTVVEQRRMQSDDPEVVRFLEAQRKPRPIPPPPAPSADLLGEPTPDGPRRALEGTPPPPKDEGIALAIDRVLLLKPGAQAVLKGSYRLAVLPKHDLVPPPPAPGPDAPALPEYGAPRPQAVITITLVIVGSGGPAHLVVPLHLPVYAGVEGGEQPSIVEGTFAVDLLARQRSLLQPQTFAIYAFCGAVWTPKPAVIATVTEAMLPRPGE
ncbi:MAG: hypothetical protein M9894_12365 [Planctomycetes bacterium]|nr:hypothetical protein [Planctomycetota bacterium]